MSVSPEQYVPTGAEKPAVYSSPDSPQTLEAKVGMEMKEEVAFSFNDPMTMETRNGSKKGARKEKKSLKVIMILHELSNTRSYKTLGTILHCPLPT